MTENKVFFANWRTYDDNREVWNFYPEEKCSYEDGNFGYLMTCEVFDKDGNELYSDHGETFEIYYNAKLAGYRGYYVYLLNALEAKLEELGLDRNIDEEKVGD